MPLLEQTRKCNSYKKVQFHLCWFIPSSQIVIHFLNRQDLPFCLGLALLTSVLTLELQTSSHVLGQGEFFLGQNICSPRLEIPRYVMQKAVDWSFNMPGIVMENKLDSMSPGFGMEYNEILRIILLTGIQNYYSEAEIPGSWSDCLFQWVGC